jgi:hypothetical protein
MYPGAVCLVGIFLDTSVLVNRFTFVAAEAAESNDNYWSS